MLEDHWEDAKHNREKGGNLFLKHNRRSQNTGKPPVILLCLFTDMVCIP